MKLYSAALIVGSISVFMGACAPQNNQKLEAVEEEGNTVEVLEEQGKKLMVVAMINSDTILNQYDYATTLRDDLDKQTRKYEKLLRQKETSLRTEMQQLQAEAATLSQFEGQRREQALYEKQQKLQMKQEEYTRKLMVLEQEYNRNIDQAINSFLAEYCQDKTYEMVISNSELGIIRWAHSSLDITNEVLIGLNAEYEQQQLDAIEDEEE